MESSMAKQSSLSTFAARALAGGAVIVAGVCSTAMNWRFGYQLGSSELDSLVLGTFSVTLDIAKWFALGLAAIAWRAGARIRATAGLAVWLVAVVYSGAAALGFSALNRDTTTAEREQSSQRIERARVAYREATALVSEAKAAKRWAATSGCTDATAPKSVEFCDRIKALEQKAAAASALLDRGKVVAADPQAALFVTMSGASEGRVKTALSIAVAVVSEVVSALGLFAVMAPPNRPEPARVKVKRRRRKPAPRLPPSAAENVIPFRAANEN
jgi:hypothetical protein